MALLSRRNCLALLSTLSTTSHFYATAFAPCLTQKSIIRSTSTSTSFRSHRLSNTRRTMSTAPSTAAISGRPTWQQTMLRVKDPKASVKFYTEFLGFTLIDTLDFPQYKFSLYFLTTLPAGESYDLTPGTQAAHDYLWNMEGVCLELTHNHGTEDDPDFKHHAGNGEGDGFGHVAVNCKDVYAMSEKLEQAGCSFKKKPDEGRMKGLAFVYDPDGYWVEIVRRGEDNKITNDFNFSQTMLRVKDPKKSIAFYERLGMKVLSEKHFPPHFSLYFLGSSNVDETVEVKDQFNAVLELTHNHGTENDPKFSHFNGNEEGKQGFGHIGFLVDDVYKACDEITTMGYGFKKEPDGGSMKGLAFAYDPDGYSIEIIKRGGLDFGDMKAESK